MRVAANPAGHVLIGQDTYSVEDALDLSERIEKAALLAAALAKGK